MNQKFRKGVGGILPIWAFGEGVDSARGVAAIAVCRRNSSCNSSCDAIARNGPRTMRPTEALLPRSPTWVTSQLSGLTTLFFWDFDGSEPDCESTRHPHKIDDLHPIPIQVQKNLPTPKHTQKHTPNPPPKPKYRKNAKSIRNWVILSYFFVFCVGFWREFRVYFRV